MKFYAQGNLLIKLFGKISSPNKIAHKISNQNFGVIAREV